MKCQWIGTSGVPHGTCCVLELIARLVSRSGAETSCDRVPGQAGSM